MNLYDAHAHYQDAWLASHRSRVFADLASAGIRHAVVNGTCESDWSEVAALAREFPAVWPSYGLHPWDAGNRSPEWERRLLARLEADPQARVGEIGLDRWILDRARPDDPRLVGLRRAPLAEQTEVFLRQLSIAAMHNLPVSIHCLDAFGPLLDLLRGAQRPARGFLLHAYSGSAESAKSFAALGAFFSFNGAFLDPRKQRLRELYAALPADRLLVETDAPAMRLPASHEKYRPLEADNGALANHPANLVASYTALAQLRGVPVEILAAQVEKNFLGFFGATRLP